MLHADIDMLVNDGAQAAARVEHAIHENTLAYNVVPLLGALGDNGYTDEEMKLQNESAQDPRPTRAGRERRPACACR